MTDRHLTVANLGLVEYQRAHSLQQAMVAGRLTDQISDTLLLLEHPHVYTLGRGADERFILASRPMVPIHRVSRGGEVTYHGPGQLVAYPILKLEGAARDVGRYLRSLEQLMINTLARFDIPATRRENLTGVWVGLRKIGSIGVGIRRWVTYHGLALNVNPDLSYFNSIVPCGINGCEMTSVAELGRPELDIGDVASAMKESFVDLFDYSDSVDLDPEQLWTLIDPELAIAKASNQ